MNILALDQSTKHTGWSFWVDKSLIKYGVIDVDEQAPAYVRMKYMGKQIKNLIRRCKPDHVVIEQVQFQRNYKVYSQLSQLQGVIMQILFEKDIAFTLVEPTKWRAFDGIKNRKREETKEAAIQAVKDKYYIEVSEDTAEAIGIGLWAIENVEDNNEKN
ncbi:MAG: crossover junction endodeoxyribonuclease RuvC [Oscillospiraceae bacterium]